MMYHTAQKVGITIMKTLTGLNRQWLLKTVLSTSMIVTVSVPQSSVTNIVGSKQERSNTTLFQTKIIANPSEPKSPEDFHCKVYIDFTCCLMRWLSDRRSYREDCLRQSRHDYYRRDGYLRQIRRFLRADLRRSRRPFHYHRCSRTW